MNPQPHQLSPAEVMAQCVACDREAIAYVRGLHREDDKARALDLCDALVAYDFDGSDLLRIPGDCLIMVDGEAHGTLVELRGAAVLLDASRRWWAAALVSVDGTPTAIVRAWGREGDDVREARVLPRRDREWRRLQSLPPIDWRGGRNAGDGVGILRVQDYAPGYVAATRRDYGYDLVVPFPTRRQRSHPADVAADAHASVWRDEWQGWTATRALMAHRLRLTRFGRPAWL